MWQLAKLIGVAVLIYWAASHLGNWRLGPNTLGQHVHAIYQAEESERLRGAVIATAKTWPQYARARLLRWWDQAEPSEEEPLPEAVALQDSPVTGRDN